MSLSLYSFRRELAALGQQLLFRRAAPFLAVGTIAFALAWMPPYPDNWTEYALALGIWFTLAGSVFVLPWGRLPSLVSSAPPLVFFASIGLIRASEGGARSGYGVLVLLPIFWFALHGNGRELASAVACTWLVFSVPILLVGAPDYPSSEWERALLWTLAAGATGATVHRLVGSLHRQQRVSRETEQRLKLVMETMPESLILLDEQANVVLLNEVARLSTLLEVGESFVGQTVDATVSNSDDRRLAPHEWPLMRALRGEPVSTVITLERPGLPKADREVSAVPLPGPGGRPAGALSVTRDVTERVRHERYFAAQHDVSRLLAGAHESEDEALWSALLEALGGDLGWGDVGALWQFDGEMLRCKAQWRADAFAADALERLSRTTALAPGHGLAGVAFSKERSVWINIEQQLADPAAFPRAEAVAAAGFRGGIAFCLASPDRTFGAIEFFSVEPLVPDEELIHLTERIADQIGQFLARIEAERYAHQIKDEFVGLVSHELRTPLSSVLGYLELALEDAALTSEQHDTLSVAHRNAERLLALVSDLLLVAQIQTGRLSLEHGLIDLQQIAHECVKDHQTSADERNLQLRYSPGPAMAVTGDGKRLRQVFDNLLANAIKFTPSGGSVEVRTSSHSGTAVVEIADTGIGIPSSEQHRVFERFFRSSSAEITALPGTGLGLALVKDILSAHRGQISFQSAEGRGTTFRIELLKASATSNEE